MINILVKTETTILLDKLNHTTLYSLSRSQNIVIGMRTKVNKNAGRNMKTIYTN